MQASFPHSQWCNSISGEVRRDRVNETSVPQANAPNRVNISSAYLGNGEASLIPVYLSKEAYGVCIEISDVVNEIQRTQTLIIDMPKGRALEKERRWHGAAT